MEFFKSENFDIAIVNCVNPFDNVLMSRALEIPYITLQELWRDFWVQQYNLPIQSTYENPVVYNPMDFDIHSMSM